jgi:hypothetical protein
MLSGRIPLVGIHTLDEYMSQPEDFAQAVQLGGPAVFERYGVMMAYQWVMGREQEAEFKQEGINANNDVNEADLDILRMRRFLAKKSADRENIHSAGRAVDEDMENEFDPFPGQLHPSLKSVGWKEGVLASLLLPIDPALSLPKDVRDSYRPAADKSAFYIGSDQIFNGIFRAVRSDEAEGAGMAMLTDMMMTKINISRYR